MAGNGPVGPALLSACLVLATAGLVTAACGPSPVSGSAHIAAEYDPGSGRLERLSYDRNQDGKPDAWVFMDGTRVIHAELDENHDGAVDRWEYFAEPGARSQDGPGAVLSRVELASGSDGVVTRREFYERGLLARVEDDTDGDGRVDKWETWAAGVLAIVALDTDGDGTADRRLVYPADGTAPRLEVEAP